MSSGALIAMVVAVIAFLSWFLVLAISGQAQTVEGGGTRFHLLRHALVGAVAASSPFFLALALELTASPRHVRLPTEIFASFLSGFLLVIYGKPLRVRGHPGPLPLVTDPALLVRTADLARALGIAPPRVRRIDSFGLEAQAYASGVQAPVLVVTDGILRRLSTEERDAILAHELGHIATGSLRWLALLASAAGFLATLASTVLSDASSFALAFVLLVALRRVVGPRVEIACDRAGGRVVGHAAMARALDKVHTVHVLPTDGWFATLVFATTTHPPLVARRAALARAAPAAERAGIAFAPRALARHHAARALALLTLGAASAGAFAADRAGLTFVGCAILIAVAVTPTVLLRVAIRRFVRRQRARVRGIGDPEAKLILLAFLVLLGSVGWFVLAGHGFVGIGRFERVATEMPAVFFGSILAFFGSTVALAALGERQKKRRASRLGLSNLIRTRRFSEALAFGRALPPAHSRDLAIRHDLALATALTGDLETAGALLDALQRDAPSFHSPLITLAVMFLGSAPERALAAASRAERELPGDPGPPYFAAQALRRLGRTEEATAAVDRALALEPRRGHCSIAAGLALDRGDLEEARRLLAVALEQAPGDPRTLIVRAEIAVAAHEDDAAVTVQVAADAVAALPFIFADGEIATLRARVR